MPSETPPPSKAPSAEAGANDAELPVNQGVNAFGVDLLQALDAGAGNVVISPPSVAIALSMVSNGASGDARAELQQAMHLGGDEAATNAALANLLATLGAGDDADLRLAQSLWVQDGFELHPEFSQRMRTTFDAQVGAVDFTGPASVERIDAWVSDRTEGLIETIAKDLGLPDPMMVLVLLNATYFHGRWSVPFDADDTDARPFHAGAGQTFATHFLTMREPMFGYDENGERQLLRLPYGKSRRFAMDLYLPAPGRPVEDVVADLGMPPTPRVRPLGEVAIPKLELAWEQELKATLQQLGVQRVWTEGALDRLSPDDRTYLSTVVHKTYLRVDEQGTRAAAVTGASIRVTSAPALPPPSFIADRPFAFVIRDTRTGVALFTGIVRDPTA